ncbi:TRAP transporter substrate-binding protein [Salicibibacter cibarius]|uniref:TRAP transporter substrate-binding protein n=1 Tax=Salicibibacter cibarius TaxID=2743000 RepID=A0A7T7CDA4_9BACI|nr:TRAP transporter substrate-binding protein [Salicibibacter cibarius]QQK77778.1 TRAP transporter substrate-binding protein [Salicibibacter cibarius]
MKRFTLLLTTILFSTGMAGCSSNGENETSGETNEVSDETTEMDFGHVLVEESTYQVTAEHMAESINEATDGEIALNIFPHSQLGSETTMLDSLIQGSQTFQFAALPALEDMISELQIMNIPYLFDSTEQTLEVLNGEVVGEMISEELEEQGLVDLGWIVAERNIFTASEPIESLEDMQSQNLRVLQTPSYIATYEALGAQPTGIDYGELYMAAEQGVVDGGDVTPEQFIDDRFVDIADYYNITRVHQQPLLLVMSKTVYDGLTPEQQEIITESAEQGIELGVDFYYQSFEESLEEMEEEGTQIIEPNLTEFQEATQDVTEDIIENTPNGQEWYDAIQEEIENTNL